MSSKVRSYQTLIVSRIPIVKRDDKFWAQDLWSVDINTNAEVVGGLSLLCPVIQSDDAATEPLDERIKVFSFSDLTNAQIEVLVSQCDVVEIPGNFGWADAEIGRRVMEIARKNGKLSILGISSNRAKTTIMNATKLPLPYRIRARIRAASISTSQRHLARRCDAVRVVGHGLVPLVSRQAKILRPEVASWIRAEDISPPRTSQSEPVSVIIASRLEAMKGVTMGMEAVADLISGIPDLILNVIGVGAEEKPLRRLAGERGINNQTHFLGQLGYPDAFFSALKKSDYVLLTNLNDEQPRLIFDAISQGAIPICPDNAACRGIGLPAEVHYERGSASSLRDTLKNVIEMPESERRKVRLNLIEIAKLRTINAMHEERCAWVQALLKARKDSL